MKHYHILFILHSLALLISCGNDDLVLEDEDAFANWQLKSTSSQIIIDPERFLSASKDPFLFENIEIENDSLKVTISYGGGCGEVKTYLITDGNLMESMPPQLKLTLSFEDHDFCKSILRDTLSFDLKPLQTQGYNTLILNLERYSDDLVYNYQ